VLIASQIISYEPQRVSEDQVVSRGPIPPVNATLLNRFENASNWSFQRPDGSRCERQAGPLLSGEKLIDNPLFKAELFRRFPQAIGGEMEGVGLAAAALRDGVPWILVKAICDWADGEKHNKHQPLAAASAVSLTQHVLSQTDVLHGLAKMPQTRADSANPLPRSSAASAPKRSMVLPVLRLAQDSETCPTEAGLTHWFRLWITNSSETWQSHVVQVVAYRAFKVSNGALESVPGFVHSHLIWSYDLDQHEKVEIAASMGRSCDIGFVPKVTAAPRHTAHVKPGTVGNESRPFVLHTRVQPSSRFNQLLPGTYKIELAIITDGFPPEMYTLDISWTGTWHEEIAKVLERDLAISLTRGAVAASEP
jgi:hypothetical protein